MKVWITKYAVGFGIPVFENAEIFPDQPDRVWVQLFGSLYKPDWHDNEADALARAEEMRGERIKAYRQAIAKLEALRFSSDLSFTVREGE